MTVGSMTLRRWGRHDWADCTRASAVHLLGLPGSGKSTLASVLARETGAVYIRVDTLEQALRDLCSVGVEGEGSSVGTASPWKSGVWGLT